MRPLWSVTCHERESVKGMTWTLIEFRVQLKALVPEAGLEPAQACA